MIPETNPYNNWSGNGSSTTFDFDFYIEDATQLTVYRTGSNGVQSKLTYGTDYSINEFKNENGSYITFPLVSSSYGVLQTGEVISLCLTLPISQQNPFGKSSYLDLTTLEYSLDYLTRICQIIHRELERAVKVKEGSDIDTDELTQDLIIVADNISDVNTVAGNIGDINIVEDNITDVNTVATNIANVNKTGNDITNVNTVASKIANVNTVAGDINRVNLVADDISSVHTVAIDISNVIDVAANKTNIDTVAGDKTNIDTVASKIANVNTVAGSISNVNTVAGDIANVDIVAGIDDYVVDVAANESNITTVATNIEDVQNAANLIETVYSVLDGGTASSSFTEGVSGGDASSVFTTRIVGGSGSSVGTIIGDIKENIRVIELHQRNDEADIAQLRADLTTETSERITTDISLQGQIDDINDEIILINQNADSLDGRITTNTDDITDAFNQIHSNDDDIAAIQLVDASQSLDISHLQSDVTTLKAEAKEVYSILSGGTASSSFTEGVSGGDAASSFTSKIIGGSASSVGSLLADAYNLIRTLTSRLSEAFKEIALLKNKDIDLQSEINAINSITGISGGTASSVFS